jgi:hypothetical protein
VSDNAATHLDTPTPNYITSPFAAVIAQEVSSLADDALRSGGFTSSDFTKAWWRMVGRLVCETTDAAQPLRERKAGAVCAGLPPSQWT